MLVIAQMMGVPKEDRPYMRHLAEKLLYIGRGEHLTACSRSTEGMQGMIEYVSPLVNERIEQSGRRFRFRAGAAVRNRASSPGIRCW